MLAALTTHGGVPVIFEVKPTIVGHRGSGAGDAAPYRENSVESFLAAVDSGLSWVELDAQRSSDGELVLWHDPVTPAGDFIVTRTADELAAAGIVRLDQVLSALPAIVGVNIDVKTIIEDATDPEPRRTHALIAAAVRRYRDTRPLFVSSFDPSLPVYLAERKAVTGEVALGLIAATNFPAQHAIPAAANLGLAAVCLHTGTLNLQREELRPADVSAARAIELAHQAGLEVMTWSPSPAQAVRAVAAGVDAVCVNDIPGVQAALSGGAPADLRPGAPADLRPGAPADLRPGGTGPAAAGSEPPGRPEPGPPGGGSAWRRLRRRLQS
jgi:glycerophosphoryl diester phosphodiesterase